VLAPENDGLMDDVWLILHCLHTYQEWRCPNFTWCLGLSRLFLGFALHVIKYEGSERTYVRHRCGIRETWKKNTKKVSGRVFGSRVFTLYYAAWLLPSSER
jgi:hypothetical protein